MFQHDSRYHRRVAGIAKKSFGKNMRPQDVRSTLNMGMDCAGAGLPANVSYRNKPVRWRARSHSKF